MTRHHLIAWPVGIAAILALVAVFALGHYFTCRNLPELAVQPTPGMTLTETAASPCPQSSIRPPYDVVEARHYQSQHHGRLDSRARAWRAQRIKEGRTRLLMRGQGQR